MSRILVTGSRNWSDRAVIRDALLAAWHDMGRDAVLVHGACPTGADQIADELWTSWGLPVKRHPADWDKHGKAAGPLRNGEMVDLGADLCLAFLMPDSRGTKDCMFKAAGAGIPIRQFHSTGATPGPQVGSV